MFVGNKELVRDYDGIYSGETLGIGLADDECEDDQVGGHEDGEEATESIFTYLFCLLID